MIKDSDIFSQLKEYLIDIEGFVPYKENAFVLIWKDKTQVDLIPFGDLEKVGVATVKGTGFISMNVEGFKKVFEEATEEIQTDVAEAHFNFLSTSFEFRKDEENRTD